MCSFVQIDSYDGKLEVFLRELENLDIRMKLLENNPDSYIKLEFELLRTELREFEALVTELHEALNGSSATIDSLYVEVTKYQRHFRNTTFCQKSKISEIQILGCHKSKT